MVSVFTFRSLKRIISRPFPCWLNEYCGRLWNPVRPRRKGPSANGPSVPAVVQVLEVRALLSAVSWTGNGGDLNWNNTANWSGNAVPGQTDDVTIGGVSSSPILVSGEAVDFHSLNSSNSIEVTNTSLSVSASSTVAAEFTVDTGASLDVTGGEMTLRGTSNSGTITADGGTIDVTVSWSSSGTMQAVNSGALVLNGNATLGNSVVSADSASAVELDNLHTSGGTLTLTGSGRFGMQNGSVLSGTTVKIDSGNALIDDSGVTLDGSTVDGNLDVLSSVLVVTNGLTLNGTLRVGATDGSTAGTVEFNGTQTLTGAGDVLLGANSSNSVGLTTNTSTLTLGSGIEVHGNTGALYGISTDDTIVNDGTVAADGGGAIFIGSSQRGTFENAGTVDAQSGSLQTGIYLQIAGETRLDGGTILAASPLQIQAGLLDGNGTITSGVTNGGTMSPGLPLGLINAEGDYTQQSTGQLSIQLGGTSPGSTYDQLDVSGNVNLSGALNVSFVNGFTSSPGQVFTIIRNLGSNPVTGSFAGLPEGTLFSVGGRLFQISYTGGSGHDVTLTDQGLTDLTQLSTVHATEGTSTGSVVLATFSDGNPSAQASNYSTTVNWGAGLIGTPAVSVQFVSSTGSVSTWQVVGSAAYAQPGTNSVAVLIVDSDGATLTSSKTTVSVADAPLMNTTTATTLNATVGVSTGGVVIATFTDGNPFAAATDYTASVNFGGPVVGTPSASIQLVFRSATTSTWQVVGNVIYASAGNYPITVTVSDSGGSSMTANQTHVSVATTTNAGILLLDANGQSSLTDSGNGKIIVGGNGDIIVASKNSSAVVLSGNASVTAAQVDVESSTGTKTSGNAKINGTVDHNTPSSAAVDPLAGLAAPTAPTTQFAAENISGKTVITLQPGTYNGGIQISGNARVTLAPGIYYMNGGGFSVTGNGSVTGSGVLIYNLGQTACAAVSFSGNASVTLSAATSGTYSGIVFFQARTSADAISISGNAIVGLAGTVYAPTASANVSGNGLLRRS